MQALEFAVDLGSSYITIYQKGVGLVLREPAVAVLSKVKDRYEIREAGYRARTMMTQSLGTARPVCPVKEGAVADPDICALLMEGFFSKILPKSFLRPKFNVTVAISSALTCSERKAIEKVFLKIGASGVTLVESPLALFAFSGSKGGLFVDIGGGKTEVASVSTVGITSGCTVNIAGDAFENAIIDYIADKYHIKIGELTANKLKMESLSFYRNDGGTDFVSGRALLDGSPRNIKINAGDLFCAVAPLVDNLCDVIRSVIASTPPELASTILENGLSISGGSSQIAGLKQYMANQLSLVVTALDDVENAVAIGTDMLSSDKQLLSDLIGVKVD